MTAKLRLNREEGRKGSKKRLTWKQEEIQACESIKKILVSNLELFRVEPDKPFVLRADASDRAIGAVLEQTREGTLNPHGRVPVAFFSRKLSKHQLNWSPREKEIYAVVEALVVSGYSPLWSPLTTSPWSGFAVAVPMRTNQVGLEFSARQITY